MAHPAIANPWTPYGLRADPFFQEPLSPLEATADAASLFVGREREVQLLGGQVLGSPSSRAIVQGRAGVGKTTVVNRLKGALADHGILSHAGPVRVTSNLSPRGFCAEVLRALLHIHGSSERASGATDDVALWRRWGRLVLGEDTTSRSVTLGPIGGGVEQGRIAAELSEGTLYDELESAFRLLSDRGGTSTLVHVNNLENLADEDAERAATLLQNLRDHFMIPHSHWVFVGASDLEAEVFRRRPQLGGIVPLAITLEPLTAEEVVEVLERRYHHLALTSAAPTRPFAPDTIRAIYERYAGDLRNFLRLLSQAGQRRVLLDRVAPMSVGEVLDLMAPTYRAELDRRLGPVDAGHLAALVRGRAAPEEVRSTDFLKASGLSTGGAQEAWQRLIRAGVLRPTRTEGRSQWHRVSGEVAIAHAMP